MELTDIRLIGRHESEESGDDMVGNLVEATDADFEEVTTGNEWVLVDFGPLGVVRVR